MSYYFLCRKYLLQNLTKFAHNPLIFVTYTTVTVGWDNSASISTSYWLGGLGIEFQ